MIKRLRPMLILAGSALVLGILLWVLVAFVLPKDDAGEEKGNEVLLIDADLTEADRVEVTNTFDEYTLVKKAIESYYIEGKEDYPVLYDNVSYLLEKLTDFTATKKLVEAPTAEQMEGYGLDDPEGTVVIVNNDDTYTLTFGTTSASGNYYCQLEGDPSVYLVATAVPDIVLLSRYQFYYGQMIEYSDEDTTENEDLTDMFISGSGREQALSITQQQLAEDEVGTSYILTEPFRHSLSNTMLTDLSDMMVAMNVASIVGDDTSPEALAEKGLDDPTYIYRYIKGGETFEVHLGDVNASGYQYCYETGGKFIYSILASDAEILGDPLLNYCEDMIYTRSVDQLAAIKVEGSNKTYNITIGEQDEMGNYNVVINNKKVDSELFSDFYSHILTISITDLGQKGEELQETLAVTFTLKDGTVEEMKFYPVSGLKCFCEVNGSGQFWVSKMNVEKILENAQKLYNGEVITLEW
ncbi:MAG: DUF4340 domain-containing protein [Clostridia bacterium]|nr:DUF4340 domain-containing protein [Clostridia bacterium]